MGFGAASGCPWCILRCGALCDACTIAAGGPADQTDASKVSYWSKNLGVVYGSERQDRRSSESWSSESASVGTMNLQALLLSPCLSPEPIAQTADIVEATHPPPAVQRRFSSSVRKSFSGRPRLASSAVSRTTSLQAQAALQETWAVVLPRGSETDEGWHEARSRTYTDLSTFAEDSIILANWTASQAVLGKNSVERIPTVTLSPVEDVISLEGLAKSQEFIRRQGWRVRDLGVRNTTEDGEMLLNQCFYLSIAHGYLGDVLSPSEDTAAKLALKLRRAIETDVLAVHPEWAQGLEQSSAGECEPMVFADFLVISMHQEDLAQGRGTNLIARMAVCILDSEMGHCEVYLGPKYEELPREQQEQGLVMLWYIPGHYQCLVNDDADGSKVRLTYEEFKAQMDANGIMYIETLE